VGKSRREKTQADKHEPKDQYLDERFAAPLGRSETHGRDEQQQPSPAPISVLPQIEDLKLSLLQGKSRIHASGSPCGQVSSDERSCESQRQGKCRPKGIHLQAVDINLNSIGLLDYFG
jgi:hypothetical protein